MGHVAHGQERRSTTRYQMELGLHYRVVLPTIDQTLRTGKTLNISTGGILFTVHEDLRPRMLMEVIIDWPVKAKGDIPLKLRVHGRVVRIQREPVRMVAVKIVRSAFVNEK